MPLGIRPVICLFFILCCAFFVEPAYAYDPLIYTQLFGFKLEKNTLSDIQKAFGQIPIIATGDAADSNYSLCYLTKDGSTVLSFWSGEMGGGNDLLGVTIYRSDHFRSKTGKPFKMTKSLGKDFVPGIQLGMSQKDFNALFRGKLSSTEPFDPPEIKIKDKYTELSFDGKQKGSMGKEQVVFDDMIDIEAKFDKDGLYEFSVSSVTQY